MLLATKIDIHGAGNRERMEPILEPEVLKSTPGRWDNMPWKIFRSLARPQVYSLKVLDRLYAFLPKSWLRKVCAWVARPKPPHPWPGWRLGSGIAITRIPSVFRFLLWRAYSSRCSDQDRFLLKWHRGLRLRAFPKDETCGSLFVTGFYEPNEFYFLNGRLKPGMVFIDVGANIGLYTIFASSMVGPQGVVLAVEPSEREFRLLKANVQLNACANVRLIPLGLSNRSGERELLIAEKEHSGHNTFGRFGYAGVEVAGRQMVKTERLDNLIQREGLERVDVIKLDVEGHERFVLEGARETLTRFKPILLVELIDRPLSLQGCSADQAWNFLINLGYQILQFDATTGLPVAADKKSSGQENIVAIHPSRLELH